MRVGEINPDNGKSTSGYLFMMVGGPLSFKTALQSVTAQSAMEAELVWMTLASKEAVYLSNMMAELGSAKRFDSAPLFTDNTGALHLAGSSAYTSRAKHIALQFLLLKARYKRRKKYPKYYLTMTKCLLLLDKKCSVGINDVYNL